MSLQPNNMPIFFPSDLFIPPKQIEQNLNIRNYNQQQRLSLRQPTKQQIPIQQRQQIPIQQRQQVPIQQRQQVHIQSIKLKNKSTDLQFKIF